MAAFVLVIVSYSCTLSLSHLVIKLSLPWKPPLDQLNYCSAGHVEGNILIWGENDNGSTHKPAIKLDSLL